MSSSFRLELNRWLASLDVRAGCVFEVGGSQERVMDKVKTWDVEKYLVFDLDHPHKDSTKPDVVLDLNNPIDVGDYENMADVVFCLEVFDYIYRPDTAFLTLAKLAKPGGEVWISFGSVYPLHQPIEDDALRYMPGGIKKLAEHSGLAITEMIPRRFETDLFDRLYRTERMRAAKGQDHNFSGWIVRLTK